MQMLTSQLYFKCLLSGRAGVLKIQRHAFKISGDMVVPMLTRHWRTALWMSTHRDAGEENVMESEASYLEDSAGTILPATTETFGANDDVQPGGGKSIPGAHTMEGPTKNHEG